MSTSIAFAQPFMRTTPRHMIPRFDLKTPNLKQKDGKWVFRHTLWQEAKFLAHPGSGSRPAHTA